MKTPTCIVTMFLQREFHRNESKGKSSDTILVWFEVRGVLWRNSRCVLLLCDLCSEGGRGVSVYESSALLFHFQRFAAALCVSEPGCLVGECRLWCGTAYERGSRCCFVGGEISTLVVEDLRCRVSVGRVLRGDLGDVVRLCAHCCAYVWLSVLIVDL